MRYEICKSARANTTIQSHKRHRSLKRRALHSALELSSSMSSWHLRKLPFPNADDRYLCDLLKAPSANNPTCSFLLQSSLTLVCRFYKYSAVTPPREQLQRFKTQFLTVAERLKVLGRSPSLKESHLDSVYLLRSRPRCHSIDFTWSWNISKLHSSDGPVLMAKCYPP